MNVRYLDATGMTCPQPIMKIAVLSPDMAPGEILEVVADCPMFEKDVRMWCERLKKTLVMMRCHEGYRRTVQIRF